MTKHDAQARLAADTVEILAAEITAGDFHAPESLPALITYLDFIRYVSGHGTRVAGSLDELLGMVDECDDITSEADGAVRHYIDEVNSLYSETMSVRQIWAEQGRGE